MHDERPRLYFDYVDPGSLLVRRRVTTLGIDCSFVGFEMRPPPQPMVEPTDPAWIEYWRHSSRALRAEGVVPRGFGIVPWTRKAHELTLHAANQSGDGGDLAMIDRLFSAFIEEGLDIGRIDVLVELAVDQGFDATTVRAVLDVDRWSHDVKIARAEARANGVRGVPTLLHAGRRMEGVHDSEAIRAFVRDE